MFTRNAFLPSVYILKLKIPPSGGFLAIKFMTRPTCAVHGEGLSLRFTHTRPQNALTHQAHTPPAPSEATSPTVSGQWASSWALAVMGCCGPQECTHFPVTNAWTLMELPVSTRAVNEWSVTGLGGHACGMHVLLLQKGNLVWRGGLWQT